MNDYSPMIFGMFVRHVHHKHHILDLLCYMKVGDSD